VSVLDVNPGFVHKVTELDMPIQKPKTTWGGYLTMLICFGLSIFVGFSIYEYTTRTDNYVILAKYVPPPLGLKITITVDTSLSDSQSTY
jgi:hypothetical protein